MSPRQVSTLDIVFDHIVFSMMGSGLDWGTEGDKNRSFLFPSHIPDQSWKY